MGNDPQQTCSFFKAQFNKYFLVDEIDESKDENQFEFKRWAHIFQVYLETRIITTLQPWVTTGHFVLEEEKMIHEKGWRRMRNGGGSISRAARSQILIKSWSHVSWKSCLNLAMTLPPKVKWNHVESLRWNIIDCSLCGSYKQLYLWEWELWGGFTQDRHDKVRT